MQQDFVTVAAFSNAMEAEAAKNFLEQNGIRAFVADENFAITMWSNLVEAKLQVAHGDADRAKALLVEHRAGADLIDEGGDESVREEE